MRKALTGAKDIPDLLQLIYTSQPFGYDAATLSSILLDARRMNTQDGITGALVCRHDIFLQLLEGPETAVQGAFARISRDDRHVDVRVLVKRPVPERLFGDWAMLHDPAQSWIWSEQDLNEGALENATQEDVIAIFTSLSQKTKDQLSD